MQFTDVYSIVYAFLRLIVKHCNTGECRVVLLATFYAMLASFHFQPYLYRPRKTFHCAPIETLVS